MPTFRVVDIVLEVSAGSPPGRGPAEMVERKGLGHPDTICDALAEAVSVALCRFYLDRFGAILHHNVDKVLLVGGASEPCFGGGEVTAPIEIHLAGRATREAKGQSVPVDELAVEACRSWLRANLRHLDVDRHLRFHTHIRGGSGELVDLFLRQARTGEWMSNDTSCGAGFAPLTPLERAVLAVEEGIRGAERPAWGEDIKVMGVRREGSFDLTVADAIVSAHVPDAAAYVEERTLLEQRARDVAAPILGGELRVAINAADDLESGALYLTVTGTSAEAGDDGQAGRGNRANGLITPYRPMTMESVAGKNPVSHVGKLYNVAANLLAEALVAQVEGVDGAWCRLVSRIGAPVREPQLVHVGVVTAGGALPADQVRTIRGIVGEQVEAIDGLAARIVAGEIGLY